MIFVLFIPSQILPALQRLRREYQLSSQKYEFRNFSNRPNQERPISRY